MELVLQTAQHQDVRNHKLQLHEQFWQPNTNQPKQAFNSVRISMCVGRPQFGNFYINFDCRAKAIADSTAFPKGYQENSTDCRELV